MVLIGRMPLKIWTAAFCAVVASFFSAESCAQIPRLVLSAGGPVCRTHQVAFSTDSGRIYAAGDDKRVFRWDLFRNDDGTLSQASIGDSLWWPVSRSDRGDIFAIAINPADSREIAVAGASGFGHYGDIAIIDTGTGKIAHVLPSSRNEGRAQGHEAEVADLAFDPSGRAIVSVSNDGEVRYWQREHAWKSEVLQVRDKSNSTYRRCSILSDGSVLFTKLSIEGQNSTGKLIHVEAPGDAPRLRELNAKHRKAVLALASTATKNTCVSSDFSGKLFFWDESQKTEAKQLVSAPDEQIRIATSIAFGPARVFLIGTASAVPGMRPGTFRFRNRLESWDLLQRRMIDSVVICESSQPWLNVAISPDGGLVAGTNHENHAVEIYQLTRAGHFLRDQADQAVKHSMAGAAEPIDGLRFSENGLQLEIASGINDRTRVFDVSGGRLSHVARDIQWRENLLETDGWAVAPPKASVYVRGENRFVQKLMITENSDARGTVTLDSQFQGEISAHCWVRPNAQQTPVLAVGTQKGAVLLFARQESSPEWQLIRYYRDHTDTINCLATSADNRFLATGSADASVRIWSLAALAAPQIQFGHQSRWGASFRILNGQLTVSQLDPAGIGAARRLLDGDAVIAIESGEADENGTYTLVVDSNPREMLSKIESFESWDQVRLTVERNGQEVELPPTVPGWEPLAVLFVGENNEWALSTPRGFYDASANGDQLINWIINPLESSGSVQRFEGKQFRKKYEKPELLRELFVAGNLQAAIDNSALPAVAATNKTGIARTVETFPTVTILEPGDSTTVAVDVELTLRAKVKLPEGRDAYQVAAWVNGASAGAPVATQQAGQDQWIFDWKTTAFDRKNQLRVRVWRTDALHASTHSEDEIHFVADVGLESQKPNLYFVGFAVGEAYPAELRLRYSTSDVDALASALFDTEKAHYDFGHEPIKLYESHVTRETTSNLCDDVVSKLSSTRPSDLLVVCLSGHGVAIDSEYYFITPYEGLGEIDPNDDHAIAALKKHAIPWANILRLADVPCRKVFIIDTCNSGQAGKTTQRIRQQDWKNAVRSLDEQECLVVCAAASDELAWEDDSSGQGFFTRCWLEALAGRADGVTATGMTSKKDGTIDLIESVRYVGQEVPRLFEFQHPTWFSESLADFINVRLLTYTDQSG